MKLQRKSVAAAMTAPDSDPSKSSRLLSQIKELAVELRSIAARADAARQWWGNVREHAIRISRNLNSAVQTPTGMQVRFLTANVALVHAGY